MAPTYTWLCGAECDRSANGHWGTTGTLPVVDATHVYPGSGQFAWRVTVAASGAVHMFANPVGGSSGTILVSRFRFYFASLPTVDVTAFAGCGPTGTNGRLGFNHTTGVLTIGTPGALTQGTTVIQAGLWYTIDWRWNIAANPWVIDWKVNGFDQPQATPAIAADSQPTMLIGCDGVADTYDCWYDDISCSATSGDYPLPDRTMRLWSLQTVSGTHNQTAGDFKDNVPVNITNGDNSGQWIDEFPPDNGTLNSQVVIAATHYIEYLYTVGVDPGTVPEAVMQIVSVIANGTATEKAQLFDGTTATDMYATANLGGSGSRAKVWNLTPTGGSWTMALLNLLRLRWGFSTNITGPPNPGVWWSGLEVAFPMPLPVSDAGYRTRTKVDVNLRYYRRPSYYPDGPSFTGPVTNFLTLTAGLSFSGSLNNRTSKQLTGGLSFTGSMLKSTNKLLAGGLSFVGTLVKRTNKLLTGGLSFAGTLVKSTGKLLTGGLSFVGTIIKRTNKLLTAGLSFTGSLTKGVSKLLPVAVLSFTGSLTKRVNKLLTGTLSFTGSMTTAVAHNFQQLLTASLSFSGSLTKRTGKSLTGGLSFSGALVKQTNKLLTAGLTFTGSITKLTSRTLSAAISFNGTLVKSVGKLLPASLSFTGSLTKRVNKLLTATLSFAGSLATQFISGAQHYFITLTASLSFSGNLQKRTSKQLTGGLSFVGTLTRQTNKLLAAGLSFVGSLQKQTSKLLTAGLSFTGTLVRQTNKRLTAGLSFTGTLVRGVAKRLTAGLSFTGTLITGRVFKVLLTASLSFTGTLNTVFHFGIQLFTKPLARFARHLPTEGAQTREMGDNKDSGSDLRRMDKKP